MTTLIESNRWSPVRLGMHRLPLLCPPFLSSCWRFFQIIFIVWRYALDKAMPELPWWYQALQWPLALWPARRYWQSQAMAERMRLALLAGGPLFIKFGQALSTRYDLLSEPMAASLALLQDQVPPVEGDWAVHALEKAWGSIAKHCDHFDEHPMASASIAQVYAARLHGGESVVVKLLKPHVREMVARDMGWLKIAAALAERCWRDGRRLRLRAVVKEFERFTNDELDLRFEAANASQMRRSFEDGALLRIPRVHWDLCTDSVLVTERLHGTPIDDVDALRAQGVDCALLAKRGVEIFFTQALRDRFFHADMHPGNIFVDTTHPSDPRYMAVDFGIVGTLSEFDQRYLAENMLAFFKQDYARVARLHVDAGWVPGTVDAQAFESAIRMVCEPIFQQPLEKISLGRLLVQLFNTARAFGMEVQPQLVLLQKTLLSIEGLGRRIDPQLDLWATAQPMIERWLKSQVGLKAIWRTCREQSPFVWQSWLQLPSLLAQTIEAQAPKQARGNPKRQRPWHALFWCLFGAMMAWVVMWSFGHGLWYR